MAREVMEALGQGNKEVEADVKRIAGAYEDASWLPKSPQDLVARLLETVYMGMSAQVGRNAQEKIEMNVDLLPVLERNENSCHRSSGCHRRPAH
jgi:hypothetical protein